MVSDEQKGKVVDEILEFFASDGQYGVETLVTQMEHACQAAKLVRRSSLDAYEFSDRFHLFLQAVDAKFDEDMVIAALLHDIGWKLAMS